MEADELKTLIHRCGMEGLETGFELCLILLKESESKEQGIVKIEQELSKVRNYNLKLVIKALNEIPINQAEIQQTQNLNQSMPY